MQARTTSSRNFSSITATSTIFANVANSAGIHVPIIAGIMPITSMSGCKRIAELAGGAHFRSQTFTRTRIAAKTIAKWSSASVCISPLEQCHDLLDNHVAGIHFYTLNQSDATREIFDSLGIPRRHKERVAL